MEHLNLEALARLVDEAPSPEEASHLAECRMCAAELEAMRGQTGALAALPEIRPPKGDWEVLEARLRSEGLIEDMGLLRRWELAQTPAWMRIAASAALFLGGGLVGAGMASREGPAADALASASLVAADDLDGAAAAVRLAEETYVTAVSRYRSLLDQSGRSQASDDQHRRYAALEYLVAASQAAVRQAPADPFLNGFLVSTMAEREATRNRISGDSEAGYSF
jgi:hypothetical protein